MKAVIAGGTGHLGRKLVERFQQDGYEVVVLSRRPSEANTPTVQWDGKTVGPWAKSLEGADVMVNFSGSPVLARWNAAGRKKILQSRVEPANAIASAIATCNKPPKKWLNASAIGYYGNRGDERVDEASLPGTGFLSEICSQWEAAAQSTICPVTHIRIGVVLGEAGAFPMLKRLAKLGLGGPVGNGQQYFSWIHETDLIEAFFTIATADGAAPSAVNGVAPKPVRQEEFMAALRKGVGMPLGFGAPAGVIHLLRKAVGVPDEAICDGAFVEAKGLEMMGFKFRFPALPEALADLLR